MSVIICFSGYNEIINKKHKIRNSVAGTFVIFQYSSFFVRYSIFRNEEEPLNLGSALTKFML